MLDGGTGFGSRYGVPGGPGPIRYRIFLGRSAPYRRNVGGLGQRWRAGGGWRPSLCSDLQRSRQEEPPLEEDQAGLHAFFEADPACYRGSDLPCNVVAQGVERPAESATLQELARIRQGTWDVCLARLGRLGGRVSLRSCQARR